MIVNKVASFSTQTAPSKVSPKWTWWTKINHNEQKMDQNIPTFDWTGHIKVLEEGWIKFVGYIITD